MDGKQSSWDRKSFHHLSEDQAFQFCDTNTTLNLTPIELESFRQVMSDTDDEVEHEWVLPDDGEAVRNTFYMF